MINKRLAIYDRIISSYPDMEKLIREVDDECEDVSKKLYLRVFVPALVGFVEWVLHDAMDRGVKKLYFLSRDGYQMYLIGQSICASRNIDIECRYLSVSRYSMRLPSYHLDIDKAMDQICVGGIDITLVKILKRAALTDAEIAVVIEEIGWQDRKDKILNYSEVMKLKKELSSSKKIYGYIDANSKECYDNAISYLSQEGMLGGEHIAVVDSGWIGTLQDSIERLMKSVDTNLQLEGYYFGMYETPVDTKAEKYHAYYFSPQRGIRRKVRFANSLFETIVSSDEGMTLSYELTTDGYKAVKESNGNPNRRQMNENIGVLKSFLEKYADNLVDLDIKKLEAITEKLMELFMSKPTMLEVESYGNNRFSADLLEDSQKKVAAELTYEQIKDQWFVNKLMIMIGLKKATIYESAWLEGSAVRCGKRIKENLMHIKLYKYFVNIRKSKRRN